MNNVGRLRLVPLTLCLYTASLMICTCGDDMHAGA